MAAVVGYHAGAPWLPGGFLGVSVFFTLSGFLITRLLVAERVGRGRIDLRAFWARRARRLLPAALAGMALATATTALAGDAIQRAGLRGDVLASLTYVLNWRLLWSGDAYGAGGSPSPLVHYWSLSIEEQFYLLFPLLVVGVLARRARLAVLGGVLVAVVAGCTAFVVVASPGTTAAYYATPARVPELLAGALLALVWAGGGLPLRAGRLAAPVGVAALGLLVASFVLTDGLEPWVLGGGLTAYALVSAVVVAAASTDSPVARVLRWRPLVGLGRVSYGVYLYHWPLLLWLVPEPAAPDAPWRTAGALGLTLLLAVVSHRVLEVPVRRRTGFGARPLARVLPVPAVALVALAALGVRGEATSSAAAEVAARPIGALVVREGAPVPPVPAVPASGRELTPTRPPGGDGERHEEVPAAASPASTSPATLPPAPLDLLVLGDSTAIDLNLALERFGAETGAWRTVGVARGGCPFTRAGEVVYRDFPVVVPEHCTRWPSEWPALVEHYAPDLVVVSAGVTDVGDWRLPDDDAWRAVGDPVYDRRLRAELELAADTLTATGRPVAWLTLPPLRDGQDERPRRTDFPINQPERVRRFNQLLGAVVTHRPRVAVVDVAEFYDSWPGGPFDPALRSDGLHLNETPEAQAALSSWLVPRLLAAYEDLGGPEHG